MHQVQLQLSDQLYNRARIRAAEAGFANLDEFIVDVVESELTELTEDLDHRFTPEVIAELDRVSAKAWAGGRTYSQAQVDEHFRAKSKAWRESRAS